MTLCTARFRLFARHWSASFSEHKFIFVLLLLVLSSSFSVLPIDDFVLLVTESNGRSLALFRAISFNVFMRSSPANAPLFSSLSVSNSISNFCLWKMVKVNKFSEGH